MSSPFDHHIDITPPITPLKSRRNCKKDLTPINVGLAQNHFKDAWSLTFRLPSLSPPPSSSSATGELDSSFDSLDTPPLSAASSSLSTAGLGSGGGGGGGLTTPLDAVHPLFGLMSLGGDAGLDPFSGGSGGGDGGKMMLDGSFTSEGPDDEDVFTSMPTRGLLFDPPTSSATSSSLNIVPPTPLLSSSAFSPPANAFSLDTDTAQYSYSSSTDSMNFFSTSSSVSPPALSSSPKTPTKAPRTSSSSPSRTPKAQQVKEHSKKKHRSRRSGKARALGLAGSNGGGVSTMGGSSSRTTTPKKGKGRAEAEPASPFAEADHHALPVPLGSRPRTALQPAPELFTSAFKTVTLSKPESPMNSPVRSVQQRRRVPLGSSSSMYVDFASLPKCSGT
ncbi:hypothetical protein FRC00_009339 [Tulasnella sp. 408]|nr:hypothetical protein FRC00_009339 [Tulasnella sp. 408]